MNALIQEVAVCTFLKKKKAGLQSASKQREEDVDVFLDVNVPLGGTSKLMSFNTINPNRSHETLNCSSLLTSSQSFIPSAVHKLLVSCQLSSLYWP